MRYRLAAALVMAAALATVPLGVAAHARSEQTPPAPVHVNIPWCAAAEDNCRVDYDGTTWTIVPVTP